MDLVKEHMGLSLRVFQWGKRLKRSERVASRNELRAYQI